MLTERERIARQATLWSALVRVFERMDSSNHESIDMEMVEAKEAARELAADAEARLSKL